MRRESRLIEISKSIKKRLQCRQICGKISTVHVVSNREWASGVFNLSCSKEVNNYEGRYSSRLPADHHPLCLWCGLSHRFHQEGHPCRSLCQVPSFLHRQAEGRRYRRSCQPLQQEVRSGQVRRAIKASAFHHYAGAFFVACRVSFSQLVYYNECVNGLI